MTIDEAIENLKYDIEIDMYIRGIAPQIAKSLEELKAYREIGTVEECKNSVLDIQKAYNKAIDDCKELTFREVVYCDSLNDRTEFREMAEQLRKKGECPF